MSQSRFRRHISLYNFGWILVLALLVFVPVQGMVRIGDTYDTDLSTPHPYNSGVPGQMVWFDVVHHPESTLIKLHFSNFDLAPGDWVIVRSPDDAYSYMYTGKGRQSSTPGTFWAVYIPGDTALVELYSGGGETAYGYDIDAYGSGDPLPLQNPESIPNIGHVCGPGEDWKNAQCYSGTMYEKPKAVMRMTWPPPGGGIAVCTAWLVGSEGHVLSNEHCINEQQYLDGADFEFMAEGNCSQNCEFWLACPGTVWQGTQTFVTAKDELDYALYHLGGNPQNTYGYLQVRQSGPVINEEFYLANHVNGYGKQITWDEDQGVLDKCTVHNLNNNACPGSTSAPGVHYWCDSDTLH